MFLSWRTITMHYESYEFILESSDLQEFRFYSESPYKRVEMVILFQEMHERLYNLTFGEYAKGAAINDRDKIGNLDRNRILATIAKSVFKFLKRFPERTIYFTGSTPSRCRLYRMAITVNLTELSEQFQIFGIIQNVEENHAEPYKKNVDYHEFFIRKKYVNL